MSMSHESTSLKKSSGDCLKLAKQWYSIWVKWCYFWTTAFSQVVQKYYLGVVGNYSIYWLLTFSVTCVPNIIKIWQCFLELQLKMSGMFFWDTLYNAPCKARSLCDSWASCFFINSWCKTIWKSKSIIVSKSKYDFLEALKIYFVNTKQIDI